MSELQELITLQAKAENEFDISEAVVFSREDLQAELLLGYPFNFSFVNKRNGKIVGYLRMIPDEDGLMVSDMVTNTPGYHLGSQMIGFAIEWAKKSGFSALYCYILKTNSPLLAALQRQLSLRGRELQEVLTQSESEDFYQARMEL